MTRQRLTEKIVSIDENVEFRLSSLMKIYETLGIERFPSQNLHNRNWNSQIAQYTPQVQDPIISFSSKSLVLSLNEKQVCKIRVDNRSDCEIYNITSIENKTDLFPKVDCIVDLPLGLKGIVMERIPILNKWSFTSGELNRLYYNFQDDIDRLHSQGIIHNDLGYAKDSKCRPNIVLSQNRIRLIDFESIKFKNNTDNWLYLLEKEKLDLKILYDELVDFACHTLT